MQVVVIILFAFLFQHTAAQCPKYDKAMNDGRNFLNKEKPDYDKALIEFQAAQIAARECGITTDTPAIELQKVFDGLKAQRDDAVKAQQRAEKADEETKVALGKAREEKERAEKAKDTAVYFRREAEDQTLKANTKEQEALKEKNRTASINLALQSNLAEDSINKVYQALQAFYLNQQFNDSKWTPEIVRALLMSIQSYSVVPLLRLGSGIQDIVKASDLLLIITDSGEIRSLDIGNRSASILWSDNGFFYVNNSAIYDSTEKKLTVKSKNSRTHIFNVKPGSITHIDEHRVRRMDSIMLTRGNTSLTAKAVLRSHAAGYAHLIDFTAWQYGSTFEISDDRKTTAAGTQNGWLYISTPELPDPLTFAGQFQDENTQVSDIAFDRGGRFIATAGTDAKFRLNELSQIRERPSIEFSFNSWVNAVYFLENMELLVGTSDGSLYKLNYDQDILARECCKILNLTKDLIRRDKIVTDPLVIVNCLK